MSTEKHTAKAIVFNEGGSGQFYGLEIDGKNIAQPISMQWGHFLADAINALAGAENPTELLAEVWEALHKFSQHVKGRIPADSSDFIYVEGVHCQRLVNVLAKLPKAKGAQS